uniref:Peptidase S1 domain-containing protein n=1 Tax=Corethron hystrix TaxID=216773 RepID=A0A7S1BBH9_9STRA|mmetsp:Transcript_19455/g.44310  ORF Transcript_19455/g.44310 Transcript_19455/m.44310 type:complete len:311 (+) Transcript_19455:123-1055(+)
MALSVFPKKTRFSPCISLGVLLVFALFPGICESIVTIDDPSEAVVNVRNYPFFVALYARGDCAGTIISRRHVVTAAHCVCGSPKAGIPVLFADGRKIVPVRGYRNPACVFDCKKDGPNRCDVAVLAFDVDVAKAGDAAIVPVYAGKDEVGRAMEIFGYGISGKASTFAGNPKKCRKAKVDRKFRMATNVVDRVNGKLRVVEYDLTNRPGEGIAEDGDSGGPALITVGAKKYIIGVNSGTSEKNPCEIGAVDQYARLSIHYNFIQNAMGGEVSPWVTWNKKTTKCKKIKNKKQCGKSNQCRWKKNKCMNKK